MRHLKLTAAAASCVFAVLAGATAASATRLCSTNTAPCASIYSFGTTLTAHLQRTHRDARRAAPRTGTIDTTVTGGASPIIDLVNQSLAAGGTFGCPTAAQWNANYAITSPVYVTNS